jgi:hypothetical protein
MWSSGVRFSVTERIMNIYFSQGGACLKTSHNPYLEPDLFMHVYKTPIYLVIRSLKLSDLRVFNLIQIPNQETVYKLYMYSKHKNYLLL